ncbi:hypothetical protein [Oligoflexus tunisiensis]|uniref:hypothetical protein n=1 Tax=Oligoflexus tunisiensis TaxID=708132 RepID=UPI00114CA602|nr:hypothetical protein [Oligoflexus tunisiensis]
MFFGKKYKVKLLGRSGMIYTEGGRSLSLVSEMLVDGDYDMVIHLSRASRWEDGTPLSDEDKAQIKSNIIKELKTSRIDWS